MPQSTKIPAQRGETTPQPWQGSWAEVAKFLVIRLAVAIPTVVLVSLIVACH